MNPRNEHRLSSPEVAPYPEALAETRFVPIDRDRTEQWLGVALWIGFALTLVWIGT